MFADVSGFTALSETMDAELLAELMNRFWARLAVVITDAGGLILEEVARFRAESAHDIAMRVGLNTGPVLIGAVGTTRESTVMGRRTPSPPAAYSTTRPAGTFCPGSG
jgi:class 3 adenylate cyclase